MSEVQNNLSPVGLTANEVSNLWSAFLKNSMELKFFEYFFATVEDNEFKEVIGKMLNFAQQSLEDLEKIFIKENLTIPIAFTNEDVKIGPQKAFSDTFILHFCYDFTMMSLSTYPNALSDCTRKDVRDFFQMSLEFSIKAQNEMVDIMLSKGIYLRHPQVALDPDIDFVGSIKYLNGLFGDLRPVNTPEIANLSRVIHRAQFSKMVFVAFSKLATAKEVKQHLGKGRDEIEKVLVSLRDVLEKENISTSASGDFSIFDVKVPPFSDKLMLFFVNTCLGIFCFVMVSQGLTSSLRSDIIYKFDKIADDMKMYYAQGLLLTIKEKWLEEPPQALDRKV